MKFFTVLIMAFVLSQTNGCGYVRVKNEVEAQLMPRPVAAEILQRYFASDWVEQPRALDYLFGLCSQDGLGIPWAYEEMTILRIMRSNEMTNIFIGDSWNLALVFVPCKKKQIDLYFSRYFSDQEIEDLANALVSMGAKFKEVDLND